MQKVSTLIILALLMISCSGKVKLKKDLEMTKADFQVRPVITNQTIEQNLKESVRVAKDKGPAAVEFMASDLFLKGNDASLNGDSALSALIFKYIVKLRPENIFLRKKYAVELIKNGNLQDAKNQLFFLIEKGDKELVSKAKLLLAGVYTALKEESDSIKIYEEIVYSGSEQHFEACIFLSKAYAKKEKYNSAFDVLNKCEKKDKENKPSYRYYKARIYFEQGNKKAAQKSLVRALKASESHFQSVLLLGHIYEQDDKEEKALKVYKSFLKNNPENYPVLTRYVNLLFARSEMKTVIPYLEKLVELDPENLNLKVRVGVLYTEANRINEAKSIFEEILTKIPNASDKVLYYLASLYQHTEDHEDAIKYYGMITAESPLYFDGNLQIAKILNFLALRDTFTGGKKGERRFKSFIAAKEKRGDLNVELNVILAEYFESLDRPNDAIRVLESLKDDKKFTRAHQYRLAILYEQTKNYKMSDAIMLGMLDENPDNADALNFLGYSMLERGSDIEQAYKFINKAISLKPNDSTIKDSLGWYYYKKGEYKKAYREIKEAWQNLQDDVVVTKHLALVYRAMKKYDKAKEYYVEALKNVESVSEREEVLKELESLENLRLPASQ